MDKNTDDLNKIKQIILDIISKSGQKTVKIILFGSRASGKNNPNSDYDFLVLISETLSIERKMEISSLIREKLASERVDADIIIKSAAEAEIHKNYIGTIVREAFKEGIAI